VSTLCVRIGPAALEIGSVLERGHGILAALAVSSVGIPGAWAQDAEPPSRRQPAHTGVRTWFIWDEEPRPGRWVFQAQPSIWYVSPGGRLTMPGSPPGTPRTRLIDLNLDNPRASPLLELNGWYGDLTLHLDAAYYRTSRQAVADRDGSVGPITFQEGEAISTRFQYTSVDATVGHRIAEFGLGETEKGNEALLLGIDGLLGFRMYNFGIRFEHEGESTSAHKTFLEPMVGVRLEAELFEEFTIDGNIMFGFSRAAGDQDTFSWNVWVGFQYRPHPHFGLQLGYRLQAFDLERGSGADRFAFRGGMAGVYGGIVLRF
jgi:hypothetical protein